jgi:hypothetical protein
MTWRSPSELVTLGFSRAPIVMMNEGHNGLQRCARTRRIGKAILPAAHAAGCRTLAMEALAHPGDGPTTFTAANPPERVVYLEQPEMWDFVEAALALGWTLVAYEPSGDLAPAALLGDGDDRYRGLPFTNWREEQQATNILRAFAGHTPMLVWCGNGHHFKTASDWVPMGSVVAAKTPVFCIDQIVTVALAEGHTPPIVLTPELSATLESLGGTAGFLVDETPAGLRRITNVDAVLLSTDNAVY